MCSVIGGIILQLGYFPNTKFNHPYSLQGYLSFWRTLRLWSLDFLRHEPTWSPYLLCAVISNHCSMEGVTFGVVFHSEKWVFGSRSNAPVKHWSCQLFWINSSWSTSCRLMPVQQPCWLWKWKREKEADGHLSFLCCLLNIWGLLWAASNEFSCPLIEGWPTSTAIASWCFKFYCLLLVLCQETPFINASKVKL